MIRIFLKPFHFISRCVSFNFPFGFAALFLLIIILQASCLTSHYEIPNYEISSNNPMSQLEEKYSVYLDSTWTKKDATALLKAFESISANLNLQFSKWNISDDALENGIKIESKDRLKFVTISRDVFPVEEAQEVVSAGKHLYYAVVQFITENGTNRSIIELILQKRYGIYVPSYDSSTEDTKSTTSERYSETEDTPNTTSERYSNFENDDLMLIISVFEEFPQALHKIPQLKYIVRRIDDNEERGISYARTGRGCIVLAESTLKRRGRYNVNNTRCVIAHEKAHFLWAYVFNHKIRADWAKLGGWYQDSTSESGWSTTKERSEFITDYAYTENPNEDMAESIANYFVYPDRLRSCCPEKYEFIHNRIMLLYGKRWGTSNLM